ncbi:MAG: cobalamin-dependent protein [Proteobacteria bacterium]|nr:cobalamin-dependent protein [Pseudomonadota bacterium]
MSAERRIRILIAKVGSDIHEWGPFMLMSAFRDAGMEAIYTGRYQSPEGVAAAAVAEAVDILALSDHTGSMPIIAAAIQKALKDKGADDIRVIAGGLISPRDKETLEKMGVRGNYSAGTPVEEVVEFVKDLMK